MSYKNKFMAGFISLLIIGLQMTFDTLSAQNRRIDGQVLDEANTPVGGAVVLIKGSASIGTQTDLDGKFSLNASDDAVLTISCIGYVEQSVPVNGRTNLSIVLIEDKELLSEVVVVGYGTQKKVNLTGSVSQVKMDEVLGDRPVINAAAALQGAIPGLTVSGGSSPSQSKSFSIRGDLSINGGSPLILIDNVEGDINSLNPNDIESVSVLKDAASAAIYGARAAAGVILVTTKQPKSGARFTLNYNNNIGFLKSINCPEQASLTEYIDAYIEAGYNSNYWAGNGDVYKWKEYLAQYKANPASLNTIGEGIYKDGDNVYYFLEETDLFKNMLETGFFHNHNIAASGGSDKLRFRIYAGLNKVNGPLLTDKDTFGRKNVSGFISADVLKWFTQEANISYSDSKSTMPGVGSIYTTRLTTYYPSYFPAETIGKAHDGPHPQARCGGQALHAAALGHNNGSSADEADAGDDLGPQAGQVRAVAHDQVEILAGGGGHGRAQADQNMGAEPGGPALVLPLNADDAAAQHRQDHPDRYRYHIHVPQTVKNG